MFLLLSQEIAVVDNFSGKIYLIVHARAGNKEDFERAQERLSTLREKLRQPTSLSLSLGSKFAKVESEISDGQFKKYVEKIRRYIYEGECMQVVPSRRLVVDYSDSPLYYDFGDFHIAGASPELLLRKRKDIITVRPLAGTRRRGQTPEEDLSLEQDLLHDEKELAEHMMLIDLGRNDVSKISEIGSVKLTEKMQIERYSHVMHIVSNVQGQSRAGTGLMDILASTFPAGTLSGAPKIRAMEIIQELEPSRRGIYGGALGYLSFAGDIDLAIGIRTAIIKDKKAYLQTGAGIVADSNPERELQETKNKVLSLLKAIRNVEEGLDN
ncbi:MAG: anthranilate synthase [Haemophilus parainfluenzae]|nr:MAG: anthranilate synthase [Haemophilus parainfluenzae]